MTHHTVMPVEGPASLAWSAQAKADVAEAVSRYPVQRSAVLPVLWIAQREWGWLSPAALRLVAESVGLPESEVFGIATFYTMFNMKPIGRHHIQVCRTLPCALAGSERITAAIKEKLKIGVGETTPDGRFTLTEVECLASCGTAPMMQVNDDYYENLTEKNVGEILDRLK